MTSLSARALAILLDGWRTGGVAYAALADRIRLLVLDGRVAPGTRLPAERELAAQLHISRTTVTAAYAELREAGFATSLRGSGSVARLPFRAPAAPEPAQPGYLDFSKATMPALPAVVQASQRAAERLPAFLHESGFDAFGLLELRQAIADRYAQRGLPTDPDQVMVTVGAQSAISLIARTIMARGDRALIENPTYPHALDALKTAGARIAPVPVTSDDGWDEAVLEQTIQRTSPSLGYLMPDNHNPTGRTMPAEQRERVLALAARHGTTLVADETMAELGFDGGQVVPFAVHGPAILVGSVGKTVWGGVRIGWIRADRTVIQRLARERFTGDLGTPILEQLVVAELLRDYDAILDARRAQLRDGHDRLLRLLHERLPDWEVRPIGGGLTTWVNLGAPVSSQLALAARNEGLVIAAGPRFGVDGAFERFLRIPFSYPAEELERGVDALARAWSAVGRHAVQMPMGDLTPSVV
ncbi:MAG TPA: PLP-dependent aminotransferase family protein [Rhodoglobus sp.]|nr:PLP-dependent aminotransferase family protein [Rhodoglobus sp.]